jgi:hypothetical protein
LAGVRRDDLDRAQAPPYVRLRDSAEMGDLVVKTNATQEDVVRAFRLAFLTRPTIADHFKPTPLAHFRSMMTWETTQVMSAVVAVKLVEVSLHRTVEDAENWRHEVGETIALDYQPASDGGAEVRIWVDSEPMEYGVDVPNPLLIHTYCHEIFGQLKAAGATIEGKVPLSDYLTPPGAPPGWPMGS